MSSDLPRLLRRDARGGSLEIGDLVTVRYLSGSLFARHTGHLLEWHIDDTVTLLLADGQRLRTGQVGKRKGTVWVGCCAWRNGRGHLSWIIKHDATGAFPADEDMEDAQPAAPRAAVKKKSRKAPSKKATRKQRRS